MRKKAEQLKNFKLENEKNLEEKKKQHYERVLKEAAETKTIKNVHIIFFHFILYNL